MHVYDEVIDFLLQNAARYGDTPTQEKAHHFLARIEAERPKDPNDKNDATDASTKTDASIIDASNKSAQNKTAESKTAQFGGPNKPGQAGSGVTSAGTGTGTSSVGTGTSSVPTSATGTDKKP